MNSTATAAVRMVLVCAALAAPAGAQAGGLQVNEHAVTTTATEEFWPQLGNDGVSNLVTFTRQEWMPSGYEPGEIWLQRLDGHGVPTGPAERVAGDGQHDHQLNDVFGDYIVWTAYDSTTSLSGRIFVYQISSTVLYGIGSALWMLDSHIHGDKVVWREGPTSGASMLMLYDLDWLGTSHPPLLIAGPVASIHRVDIGERYVVWAEVTSGQLDIAAYDLAGGVYGGTTIRLTETPDIQETEPSIDGPWIAWEARDDGASSARIVARNMDTSEVRVVADGGVSNYQPSVSGDVITYNALVGGVQRVFLYRISTRETWPLSTQPLDTYYHDVFGNLVAYVDLRTGNEDIYVADFAFTPASHCVAKTNSQGCVPAIGYSGTPALSGPDDFVVTASNVLSNSLGILIWSGAPASTPFGGGTLCLAPPILRTPTQSSGGNPPPRDCSGTYSFHFSHDFLNQHFVTPGSRLCAQFYSRDPGFPAPNNIGLTDSLHFTIGP